MHHTKPATIPPSTSSFAMNVGATVLFCLSWYLLIRFFPLLPPTYLTAISLMFTFVPLWLYDILVRKVHLRASTGLNTQAGRRIGSRIARKLIALYATLGIVLIYYLLINHFFHATYLDDFLLLLEQIWILILLVSAVYVIEVDRRQKDPDDIYWKMGNLLTGKSTDITKKEGWHYAKVWFIKGFFTPFVFIILMRYQQSLGQFQPGQASFLEWHAYILDFLYTVDVMFAVLGYVFTCRLLDNHIRSTDPTLLGWIVCLVCYGPFHTHLGIGLLAYDDGVYWHHWLGKEPIFYYFYGAAIVFLTAVYAFATVAIGYRMSNLTYRGLITSGPYRFTKHPAYLAKVGSWWLISVPFFSLAGEAAALKHCAALLGVSMIYFLRARTEENHLSNYPEYREYARWIDDNGAFKTFKKIFPFLRFSADKRKRWGSVLS